MTGLTPEQVDVICQKCSLFIMEQMDEATKDIPNWEFADNAALSILVIDIIQKANTQAINEVIKSVCNQEPSA